MITILTILFCLHITYTLVMTTIEYNGLKKIHISIITLFIYNFLKPLYWSVHLLSLVLTPLGVYLTLRVGIKTKPAENGSQSVTPPSNSNGDDTDDPTIH